MSKYQLALPVELYDYYIQHCSCWVRSWQFLQPTLGTIVYVCETLPVFFDLVHNLTTA